MPAPSDGSANPAPPLTEFSQDAAPLQPAATGALGRVLHVWSAAETAIVGSLAAASLLIVVYTIVVRLLVPRLTPAWADETTVYLMIWGTLIACSSVTAKGRHVRADLLTSTMAPSRQAALEFASYIAGAVFTALLAWYGYAVARDAYEFNDLSTTTLRFPMWIYYACLPVGAGLMTLRYLVLIALAATGARSHAAPPPSAH